MFQLIIQIFKTLFCSLFDLDRFLVSYQMACYLDLCKIYKEEKCQQKKLISAIVIKTIHNHFSGSILVIFEGTGKIHKIFPST